MAAIQIGTLNFKQVFVGDLFDVTFDITSINLTGKTLVMTVFDEPTNTPILTFQESDGSLVKTVVSTTLTTVQLLKHGGSMVIPVLAETSPENRYYLLLKMYSVITDKQTILKGYFEVVDK